MKAQSKKEHYSNTAAVIQSSGGGKSRMVDEQAELVFTIPLNLRAEAESKRNVASLLRMYFRALTSPCFSLFRVRLPTAGLCNP